VVIDVLVILMVLVVVATVIGARRRAASVQRSGRDDVLAALAPVVAGSVSADQTLTGSYRGYDVQAWLRTASPTPPDTPGTSNARANVEIVRLRLLGARGGQHWSVWRAWTIPGMTWHFARSDGHVVSRLMRLGGMPQPDPDLPDRLRAAGMIEAFERLGPRTNDSFPRIQFMPDLRAVMLERMRAMGREIPDVPMKAEAEAGPWLEVEVERTDERDPTPDRFREILDTTVGIAELNARVNP
jgi:hypothetical protein